MESNRNVPLVREYETDSFYRDKKCYGTSFKCDGEISCERCEVYPEILKGEYFKFIQEVTGRE